ncbi:hypothetical protein RQP46_002979 [Phenoliferia psychrophenolica]
MSGVDWYDELETLESQLAQVVKSITKAVSASTKVAATPAERNSIESVAKEVAEVKAFGVEVSALKTVRGEAAAKEAAEKHIEPLLMDLEAYFNKIYYSRHALYPGLPVLRS